MIKKNTMLIAGHSMCIMVKLLCQWRTDLSRTKIMVTSKWHQNDARMTPFTSFWGLFDVIMISVLPGECLKSRKSRIMDLAESTVVKSQGGQVTSNVKRSRYFICPKNEAARRIVVYSPVHRDARKRRCRRRRRRRGRCSESIGRVIRPPGIFLVLRRTPP